MPSLVYALILNLKIVYFYQFLWQIMVLINILVLYSVQIEVIRGLAVLKKATAIVNKEYGLDAKLADVIVAASDEVHSADDDVFRHKEPVIVTDVL